MTDMHTVPSPRLTLSDLVLCILGRVLSATEAVPDSVLIWDDGFSPQARDLIREARIALRCAVDAAPFFGLVVRPSAQMLPLDPSLSRGQRAILNAVVAE